MKGKNRLIEFVAKMTDINGVLVSIQFIFIFFFFFFFFEIPHDYNTRQHHEIVSENDKASNHDPLAKLEDNIINSNQQFKGRNC